MTVTTTEMKVWHVKVIGNEKFPVRSIECPQDEWWWSPLSTAGFLIDDSQKEASEALAALLNNLPRILDRLEVAESAMISLQEDFKVGVKVSLPTAVRVSVWKDMHDEIGLEED